jgi:hypothetical protein
MSTYPQYTLKSQDVYNFTINTLDALPLTTPGAIHSRDLLRVLVFATASRLSVHQACQQLERAPSGSTVLETLAQQLSDLDRLEGHANDLLARLLPKGLGKRGHCVAIDLIALPYHSTVEAAHQDEVYQGRWTSYTLKSPQESHVDFDLAVVCHNTRGHWERHQREALLYATWGIKHRSLSWIRATYRGRFSIESSYRQVH